MNYYEFTGCIDNRVDPDQLASSEASLKKPDDLDLHCVQES